MRYIESNIWQRIVDLIFATMQCAMSSDTI